MCPQYRACVKAGLPDHPDHQSCRSKNELEDLACQLSIFVLLVSTHCAGKYIVLCPDPLRRKEKGLMNIVQLHTMG